jgi:Flp pilus assembly protein TadB
MTFGQRLRRLDERVTEGRNGRWFVAALALVFLVMLVLAATTHSLTRVALGLLTPAAVAGGVVFGMRWSHRR